MLLDRIWPPGVSTDALERTRDAVTGKSLRLLTATTALPISQAAVLKEQLKN